MVELFWRVVAWFVSCETISDWLIVRAVRTPYSDIVSRDGQDVYMRRFWLFNPYTADGEYKTRYLWCPISIRVHHIVREDRDAHLHDHPWNARTIVLSGGYWELRDDGRYYRRERGDTARIRFGQFHRITEVDPVYGAVTLFITGRKRGTWGFKVPYREYLAGRR